MISVLALLASGCAGSIDPKPDPHGGDSLVDSADTADSHDSAPIDADGDGYASDGTADLEIRGAPGDELGTVTGSGDVDGDGVTDLLLGAYQHAPAGAVYTISGARLVELAGR